MGLFKALGKLGARMANRSYTDGQVKKAPSKAYKQTGKQIAEARKKGVYVDGSKLYKINKSNNIRTATKLGSYRDDFINDL